MTSLLVLYQTVTDGRTDTRTAQVLLYASLNSKMTFTFMNTFKPSSDMQENLQACILILQSFCSANRE